MSGLYCELSKLILNDVGEDICHVQSGSSYLLRDEACGGHTWGGVHFQEVDFVNRLADRIYYFDRGGIRCHDGNYLSLLQTLREEEAEAPKAATTPGAGVLAYRAKKQEDARIRRDKKRLETLEKNIAEAESRIRALENALCEEDVASDYGKTTEISGQLEREKTDLAAWYAEWETLCDGE